MTYEYVCLACHHEWEAEQSISADPLTDCPKCHAAQAKRMVSGGAGFILKGGGWYADGYGSSSGSAKGGSSPTESTSSESKTETKKEAKKPGDSGGSESNSKGKSAST